MKMFYRAYDLDRSPTSFDYFTFLCAMATEAYYNNAELEIVFIPADNVDGVREEDKSFGLSIERQKERIKKILIPGTSLVDARLMLFPNRASAVKYCSEVGALSFGHFLPLLTDAHKAFGDIRRLRTSFLKEQDNKKYITITLRQSFRHSYRNSNVDAWNKFAKAVTTEGDYDVIVLPDTDTDIEQNRDIALDVQRRFWLYEFAEMNFGVCGGPITMCFYSEAPCRMIYSETNAHALTGLNEIGLPPGSQMSFARPTQRIVWEKDTFDNIWKSYSEWRNSDAA